MVDVIQNGKLVQSDGKPVTATPPAQPALAAVPLKGWKTLSVAAGFLLTVLSSPDVQQIISQYPKGFATGVAFIVIILRALTSTPLMKG